MKSAVLVGESHQQLVELRFDWSERHQGTGEPLREWVRSVPGRRWEKSKKTWIVDVGLLAPGTLTLAGFTVLGPDGRPAKRAARNKVPPPPIATFEVPDWFGLELYGFQRAGAEKLLREARGLLADEPGLGKTRTALAVGAATGARRIVVVAPASVLAHWESEAKIAFGCDNDQGRRSLREAGPSAAGAAPSPPPPGASHGRGQANGPNPAYSPGWSVVVVRPGRKEPALPSTGAVVCSDSMLAARPALVEKLCAWGPDLFVYDEVHRAKTWGSKRSIAGRRLADASRRALALSGTPVFAHPDELVPALDMTGHLDRFFGGRRSFVERYCYTDSYGQLRPRKARLGELHKKLEESVWVRRLKADVLTDLPPKSRQVTWLEIDARPVKAAHSTVYQKIDSWLAGLEHQPDEDEVWAWCHESLPLVSDMRRAAGLAKVGPLAEMISDFVAGDSRPAGKWDRPLVVWAHHKEVVSALARAVPNLVGNTEVIAGATPVDRRAEIVERFQAGLVPVLVCSITAAGVGITLTRSADVIFAEVDWTPALVAQAEDRCARIGQTRPVQVTTVMAPGTLDETVARVLANKADVLRAMMGGGDNDVVAGERGSPAAWVLRRMVRERLRQAHGTSRHR